MNINYAIIQFLFWFSFGSVANFTSVYLLGCGLSNTAIGLISSAGCAVSVLLQPAIATYADREDSISIKSILLFLYSVLTVIGILLAFFYRKGSAVNGFLMGLGMVVVQLALPFANALATEMTNAGKNINYSVARGIGSLGYAVMSLSIGRLAASRGPRVIPWMIMASAFALMLSILRFPFERNPRRAAKEQTAQDPGAFFRRYSSFLTVLAGCVLIYTGHVLINSFVFQIVSYKGGNSEHMGIVMAIAGILEVFSMFLFHTLLKWKDCSFWFRICGIFFTLKCLGTLLAGSMGALYAVQILQPFGWGLMMVASVYYVNELMEEHDKIKGQAYMTMTLSMGNILGALIGGWLIDTAGVPGMLTVSVVLSAIGAAVVLLKGKRIRA